MAIFATAYYLFSASRAAHTQVLNLGELEIDLEALKRAFALLVLRGFELFGAKQNGRPLSGNIEKSYADKVPRLTRVIFRCLSVPSPEAAAQFQATQEVPQLQDFRYTPSPSRNPSRSKHTRMDHQ